MKIKELKSQINTYKKQDFDIPDVFENIKDEAYNKDFATPPKKRFTFKVRYAVSFAVIVLAVLVSIPIIRFTIGTKNMAYEPSFDKSIENAAQAELDPYPAYELSPESSGYSEKTYYNSISELNNVLGSNLKESPLSTLDSFYYDNKLDASIYVITYNQFKYYFIASFEMNSVIDAVDSSIPRYTNHSHFNEVRESDNTYYVRWISGDIEYLLFSYQNDKVDFIDVYNSVK